MNNILQKYIKSLPKGQHPLNRKTFACEFVVLAIKTPVSFLSRLKNELNP